MRTAFVGAVEGSAIALNALNTTGLAPQLVMTLPLEKGSRHSDFVDLEPLASAAGSQVVRVANINGEAALDAVRTFDPDLMLVIGWSQICRAAFRSVARVGNIGFHPAPLPRMRGRAVIPWTILLGATRTAASLFWLDDGVDSGPLLLQEEIEVAEDETARSLYLKQTAALARMLPKAVELVRSGSAPRVEQDHSLATYCAKRTPEDGRIDWREPATSVLRLIRAAGEPYPGAFTSHEGRRLIIDAATILPDSSRFIGITGQVQCHTPEGFAVRCGDGECVHVTAWRVGEGADRPRLHSKLGVSN